jgi:secreted trypsin-like serine protease
MKKLFYAVLLMLLTTVAARAQKIVGGQASPDDKPFYARIVWAGYPHNTVYASGTLIAPDWILTSGVAVTNMFIQAAIPEIDVYMGSSAIFSTPASAYRVSDYIVRHPGFSIRSGYIDHDIALVHLSTPVTGVTPMSLPAQGDNSMSAVGTAAIVLGHGMADTSQSSSVTNELRMASINIIHNDTCNQPGRHNGAFTPDMLCAGKLTGAATGPAGADFGGPLYVETGAGKVQVGIVSMPEGQQVALYYANSLKPGIFTRVANYRRWIDSVIADYRQTLSAPKLPEQQTTVKMVTQNGQVKALFPQALAENATYVLYGMDGRLVSKGSTTKGTTSITIDVAAYPAAMYIFRLVGDRGAVFTAKCNTTL